MTAVWNFFATIPADLATWFSVACHAIESWF
jgi:hypothetical protein